LRPHFGEGAGFSSREASRHDEGSVAWYWNEYAKNEHTPARISIRRCWVAGRDLPDKATDTIPPANLIAPAVVIDLSAAAAADPDLIVEPAHREAREAAHVRIASGTRLLLRQSGLPHRDRLRVPQRRIGLPFRRT